MAMLKYCLDCEELETVHWQHWIDAFFQLFIPEKLSVPYRIDQTLSAFVLNITTALRLGHFSDSYALNDLSPRLAYFIEAARKRGLVCQVLKISNRYTEHLKIMYRGKSYYFQSYPTASNFDGPLAWITGNKARTKKYLRERGFPVAPGKEYYFWQKERAIIESIAAIGFPLVVKPLRGTFGRHITTNIQTENELRKAIQHAIEYQPRFIIEQYVDTGPVYRISVVDFKYIACVQYSDVEVRGDGTSSITTLIQKKNADPLRRVDSWKYPLFWPVLVSNETDTLLKEQGFAYDSIPMIGTRVKLQRTPFLRWGADLIDRTDEMHPHNKELVENVMRNFNMHVGGIDVIMEDIKRPWNEQRCAILEINNLPCIDMHHVPTVGNVRDVASPIVNLFLKYYTIPSLAKP